MILSRATAPWLGGRGQHVPRPAPRLQGAFYSLAPRQYFFGVGRGAHKNSQNPCPATVGKLQCLARFFGRGKPVALDESGLNRNFSQYRAGNINKPRSRHQILGAVAQPPYFGFMPGNPFIFSDKAEKIQSRFPFFPVIAGYCRFGVGKNRVPVNRLLRLRFLPCHAGKRGIKNLAHQARIKSFIHRHCIISLERSDCFLQPFNRQRKRFIRCRV